MNIFNYIQVLLYISLLITVARARQLNIVGIDERWICNIKHSCLDCLRLPQCSWCPGENKCFSAHLNFYEDYCEKEKIEHINYGMSLEENAECACAGDMIVKNCQPPESSGPDCSGRGSCVCGRCFCDQLPDPENSSKAIMGQYCEYDNFSCSGPKCNEGPYSIHELKAYEENYTSWNN